MNLLATMITTTTYGSWLPGDLRGYVEDGIILPGDPKTMERASMRMLDEPVLLTATQQDQVFHALVTAADEFRYRLVAVSIECWHVHLLLTHGCDPVATVAGRLKTRMRQALDGGRVWTTGYDKRYCFDEPTLLARAAYIHRHPGNRPLPPPFPH